MSPIPIITDDKRRCDDKFHRKIKRLTESNIFNGTIIAVIMLNALTMALETENAIKESWGSATFKFLDDSFLIIYSVEFLLKIYAEPKDYWKSTYNLFDFVVLAISLVQVCLGLVLGTQSDQLNAFRVLRALRTLRTLRTISFIKGLQVLVIALLDTIRKWVINIIILLLLMMFLFAIMGYYFFGYQKNGDTENWGSLGKAMLTLFTYVTVDGWTELQQQLEDKGITGISHLYSVVFIFLGHFIFTNVFIGVIIMNISEATETYKSDQIAEREAILRHKKDFMMRRQHNDVKRMLERQKKGQYSNFQEMVREFQKALRHDDSVMVSDISTNIIWMETYNRTLDHMDDTVYKLQQLHFETANNLAACMERRLRKKYGTL